MKATFISKEKNDVKFTLEFSAEEFENAQVRAYQQNKDKFEIDGFRKGKAPRSIIEKRYGEGVFFDDAIDYLFGEYYGKAVDELGLDVIDRPRVEFTQLKKGEPFIVTLTVEVFPEVEIKDYKGVEIEKVVQEVSDKDVENDIIQLQKRNARMVSVEREAKNGDTVVLDYAGFVGDNQFEGGTAEKQKLTLGSGMFIPGFEDQLVGIKAGESREVKVTFPEEYQAADLAGKDAVFKCTVHEVQEEQLPEIDDDFAQDVSEYDTLDELKAKTRERLESYAKASADNEMKDAAIQKVMELNDIEAPKQMVEDEIDRMAQELDQQLRYQGMGLDQYLGYMGQDYAEFRETVREDAAKSVKIRVILENIARMENIEVAEADIDAELENMGKQYGMDKDKVKEVIGEDNLGYFTKDLKVKKAIDLVFENAKIKAAKKTAKKSTKKAADSEKAEEK